TLEIIQITSKALNNLKCDAIVVGAANTRTGKGTKQVVLSQAAKQADALLEDLLSQLAADREFKGSLGELTTVHPMGRLEAKRLVLVGLGSQETLDTQSLRRASAIAARHLQNTGAHTLALALGSQEFNIDIQSAAQAQIEGTLLG